jgi:glutaminyl-tRNA synthetase
MDAEVRIYDTLFLPQKEGEEDSKETTFNPESLIRRRAKIEPSVKGSPAGSLYQFERVGYFCTDKDSTADHLVFNRTVQLRDTWAKIEKKSK